MIRSLAVSVWILGLTLAGVYFGIPKRATPAEAAAGQPGKEETASIPVALRTITVPVILNGALQGFVQTQMIVSAKSDLLKSVPQPAELFMTDAALKTIYFQEQIDFSHIQKQDLAKLSKMIVESINARAGVPVASELYIQEMLYVPKSTEKASTLVHH
jgi:hypothetical protein